MELFVYHLLQLVIGNLVHFIIILSLRKFITGLTLTIELLCWWYHIKYRKGNTILNPNSTETREWSTWEHWNACIGTCGHGTQSRRRVCINDRYYECNRETDVHLRDLCLNAFFSNNQRSCVGTIESRSCYSRKCPGKWSV